MNIIERTKPIGGSTTEQLIEKYCKSTNPVTRAVYLQIINNRLVAANTTNLLQ